jgi:tetratricopeptide (TPR) repeat protein
MLKMLKNRNCCGRNANPCLQLGLALWLLIGLTSNTGRAVPDSHDSAAKAVRWPTDAAFFDVQEGRLIDDAADGHLHQYTLIDAALIAEGVRDPQRRAVYRDQFQRWARQLGDLDRPDAPPRERAAMLLSFLHNKALTIRYDPDSSQLTQLFETGHFNCVSSTVLFQAMCHQIGLPAWPLVGAGHVSCVVPSGDGCWLVETTSADWPVVLETADPRADASVALTAQTASLRRRIRPAQLVAVIYYNRAIRLLDAGNYHDSLAANLAAWRIDPGNPDVWQNLLAVMNNWAVALASEGQYADAVALLAKGRQLDPGYDKFLRNELFVFDRWQRQMLDQQRGVETVELLEAADRRHRQIPTFARTGGQSEPGTTGSCVAKSQRAGQTPALSHQPEHLWFDVTVPVR